MAPIGVTLGDALTIAQATSAQMAALAQEIGDAFRSQLGQTMSFLEQALPHIEDAEQRAEIEALIVQFAQDEFRLALLLHEATLRQFELDMLALGTLDEATQAWITCALAGLAILQENFDSIIEGIGEGVMQGFTGG